MDHVLLHFTYAINFKNASLDTAERVLWPDVSLISAWTGRSLPDSTACGCAQANGILVIA